MKNQEFYQIFENGHPIVGATFETKKGAQEYLKKQIEILRSPTADTFFVNYEQRLSKLPIRDILFLKKKYADGHEESTTLVIRHMKISSFNTYL